MKAQLVLWAAVAAWNAAAASATDALPSLFVPNRGQVQRDVHFLAKGRRMNGYFHRHGATFRLDDATLHIDLVGATGPSRMEPAGNPTGEVNFLIGTEDRWQIGVPIFQGVVYREVYSGIDMVYGASGPNFKNEFTVAPGEDPERIQLRYAGADELRREEDGSLYIRVGRHQLRETVPVIYQVRDGIRVAIEGGFAVNAGIVSFIVGGYDRTLPLVIDPVLIYLTLFGGSGADAAMSLAIDASGAAYLAGFTASYDLPTGNPEQNFNAGGNEVFVAKLSPAGNGLIYCTYIGGRGDDRATGIAVDASGAAYVTGATTSTNFPVKAALQPKLAGGKNAFILKLAPAGNALAFSTYLGGTGSDSASGIALDPAGNVYITGDMTSLAFPASGYQKSNRGQPDAFVAKIAADGSRLVYSTYLGGSSEDHALGIAVDASGSACITGSTYSMDFPIANAHQTKLGGGQDAFVTKLSADGRSLIFSTFLGGSGGIVGSPEAGQGIAVDAQGNAYIAGVTSSTDFPIRNAAQTTNAGWQDAFAAKFSATGLLLYSTYIGGVNVDIANAIAVDTSGYAYIAGQTTSANLVSLLGLAGQPTGTFDAFAVKLAPSGNAVAALLYLGGAGADTATAIVVDVASNIYIAGWTQSPNFGTINGLQTINGGNYSAFVGKLRFGTIIGPIIQMSNLTRPGSSTFQVGDNWKITMTGAPNQAVTVSGTTNGSPWGPIGEGQTDASGAFSLSGTMKVNAAGNWTETWCIGGIPATAIDFTVTAAPMIQMVNLTNPLSTTFQVGDSWRISITGAPGQPVTVTGTTNGSAWGPIPEGWTDASGNFSMSGTMKVNAVGNWTETWCLEGYPVSPVISFRVD